MKTTTTLFTTLALPLLALAAPQMPTPNSGPDCDSMTGNAAELCYYGRIGFNTAAAAYLETALQDPALASAFDAVGDAAGNMATATGGIAPSEPTDASGNLNPIAALTAVLPGIGAANIPASQKAAVSSIIIVGVSLQTAGATAAPAAAGASSGAMTGSTSKPAATGSMAASSSKIAASASSLAASASSVAASAGAQASAAPSKGAAAPAVNNMGMGFMAGMVAGVAGLIAAL